MELKSLLSRIRWSSVIALLLLIAVVILIAVKIPISKYNVQGNIALDASADPGKIKLGERSTIEVEVKNMDKDENVSVNIEALTYDDNFLFVDEGNTYVEERGIPVGPQEVRTLKFKVKAMSGALPGRYRVDVKAWGKNYAERAEDTVYIKVTED